jgi:hypothetical protein
VDGEVSREKIDVTLYLMKFSMHLNCFVNELISSFWVFIVLSTVECLTVDLLDIFIVI